MTKPIDVKDGRENARRKGFTIREDTDHEYHFFAYEGRKTAWRIKISFGQREQLRHEMQRDGLVMGMTASDVRKIMACEHSAEWVLERYTQYLKALQDKAKKK